MGSQDGFEFFDWTWERKELSALDGDVVTDQRLRLLHPNMRQDQCTSSSGHSSTAVTMTPTTDPAELRRELKMAHAKPQAHEPSLRELLQLHEKPRTEATESRRTLAEHGEMWSKGGENHPRDCTPCAFYCFKRQGCADGDRCHRCHMNHSSRRQCRRRRSKAPIC